ncbi:SusD family protein [bacterium A37T11]|nr:SusD family protein [bacterium A37T11]
MKKRALYFLLSCAGSIICGSCNHYLDVKPKDQYLQDKVFSNEATIHEALNGIYLRMASPTLYGKELTMGIIDVMGQYYNLQDYHLSGITSAHQRISQASYAYQDTSVANPFSRAWQDSYTSILNINSFIGRLKGTMSVISETQKSLLLGEAYGLRAFLHFDLLRMFGPVYAEDSGALSIPYMVKATDAVQPLLPASAIADSIGKDIQQSLLNLQQDPVRGSNSKGFAELASQPFFQHRDRRFNYYAAQLLQARVNLYTGHKQEALEVAESLISEAAAVFPWDPDPATPDEIDPIFPGGIIFNLPQPTLRQQYLNLFESSLPFETLLMPDQTRLFSLYKYNLSDYYYISQWTTVPSSSNPYVLFIKYRPATIQPDASTAGIPLSRLSEAYYIVAECTQSKLKAIDCLNQVRKHRGEILLNEGVDLGNELLNAYLREFWGEGQLFYFFKRNNLAQIPNGRGAANSLNMDKNRYVVPLPLVETQRRGS